MLKEVLGLNRENNSPKHLIYILIGIFVMGLLGILKPVFSFAVLYGFILFYSTLILAMKVHKLFLLTAFLILTQVIEHLYIFFTGSVALSLLFDIITYAFYLFVVIVFILGIYKAMKQLAYAGHIIYVVLNGLVLISLHFISKTFTVTEAAFETPEMYFVNIFLTCITFFFVVLLSRGLVHKGSLEISL